METIRQVDFVGIGAEKAATSWLYSCLIEHPQICNPGIKEIEYFENVKIFSRPERKKTPYEENGIEPYLDYFAKCPAGSLRGEFTATYLHDKRVAPILKTLFPDVKIIVVIRNPVDRAFSQYTAVKHILPYRDFEEAIVKESEFLRRSTYAEYLKEYFDRFPREHILVLRYDDIRGREVAYVQDVYRFLGVNPTFVPAYASRKERTAEEKRLVGMRHAIERMPLGDIALRLANRLGMTTHGKELLSSLVPHETVAPTLRRTLAAHYMADIETTEKLTGLDLSAWK